jgi:hypothetical protein
MPVISALKRLKQKDLKFKASLGYVVRPCLNTVCNSGTTLQNLGKVGKEKRMTEHQ